MLLYVAGATDAEESARAELLLSAGSPLVAAEYAEALAVFNSMPLALASIEPPEHCRRAILARVAADHSAAQSMSGWDTFAGRYRWPIYAASSLAACLAVALTLGAMNYSQLRNQNAQLATTIAESESVLRSPYVSVASLQTKSPTVGTKASGRVLYCPVAHKYQFTLFGLPPLPSDKAYQLWLLTADNRKIPACMFSMDQNGVATALAKSDLPVTGAAVTVEPATGSRQPSNDVLLVGQFKAAN
ncbi:MAG: anti-sigma factor [Tepidisphaeraceae bacterium]